MIHQPSISGIINIVEVKLKLTSETQTRVRKIAWNTLPLSQLWLGEGFFLYRPIILVSL